MSLQVIVIPADDEASPVLREIEGELKNYQDIVGGLITATDMPSVGASFYSNDEGLLLRLPFNRRATAILHHYEPLHTQYTILVGDVVLVGLPDQEGNTTDVPTKLIVLLEV